MAVPTNIEPRNPGEIALNGQRYKIKGTVRRSKATQLAPQNRTGDSSLADQQYANEVIWSDLTGGLGVINMNEQEFPDRFSDSNMWTMTKNYWTLPPKVNSITQVGAAFNANPVNGITYGGFTYIGGGNRVKRFAGLNTALSYNDTGTNTWVTSGGTEYSLPAVMGSPPIAWKGDIWFPCNGLVRYDIATTTFATVTNASGGGSILAVWLAVYDEDLVILDSAGALYSTNDNATSINLTSMGSIDTFENLNGLLAYRNLIGEPALIASTERGIFIHSWDAKKWYRMGIDFPDANASNGEGLCSWDGDAWYGKASNMNQIVNGARIVRGPNQGDGVPTSLRSVIAATCTSFDNYLIAAFDSTNTTSLSSWMGAYNRKGWHVLAKQSGAAETSVFADAFTRADSATTLGASWTTLGTSTWGITSNKAYLVSTSSGDKQAVNASAVSDCNVTVDLATSTATDSAMLVFRSDASVNNYWRVLMDYVTPGVGPTRLIFTLASVSSAVATNVASYDAGSGKTSATVEARLSGSAISIYIDGVLRMSTTSTTHQSNTRHGIGMSDGTNGGTSITYDNFEITTGDPTRITSLTYVPSTDILTPGLVVYNESLALKYIKLFDTTDNPEQFLSTDFNASGELILPKFDANMANVQKTLLSAQVRVLDATSTETVKISFATDDSPNYTYLMDSTGVLLSTTPITASGNHTLYFDADKLGNLYYNVRFKIELASGSATLSPKIVFLKLRYLKEFETLYSYNFTIDLNGPQPDQNFPADAYDNLDTAIELRKLVPFTYHSGGPSEQKLVLISGYTGPVGTATDQAGEAHLTVLEVTPQ